MRCRSTASKGALRGLLEPSAICRTQRAKRCIVRGVKRIAIIGSGGAGKTTLGRTLSERLGIPVIHLDAHFWTPGWVPTPREDWVQAERELMQPEAWIVDGNFFRTMDARLALADTVIFLDLPRLTCLARVLKRRVRYHGRSRPDMAAGCPEKIDLEFLRWIWDYPRTKRPAMLEKLASVRASGRRAVHLRSASEVARFLEAVNRSVGLRAHGRRTA